MSEIERFAKDAEDMREAYQSTVEHKGENALCIEKFYLRLWTAAAEALREKQERDKGCEYCADHEDLAFGHDSLKRVGSIYIDKNLLVADLYSESMAVAVCFCPMCGKRLEVEP